MNRKVKFLDSTRIQEASFVDEMLIVEFMNGVRYLYFDISPLDFAKLTIAESPGATLNKIASGKRYERLES
jgi:hypothetical protein